jgi:hypothetical protein
MCKNTQGVIACVTCGSPTRFDTEQDYVARKNEIRKAGYRLIIGGIVRLVLSVLIALIAFLAIAFLGHGVFALGFLSVALLASGFQRVLRGNAFRTFE